jgi:hypothetical protein
MSKRNEQELLEKAKVTRNPDLRDDELGEPNRLGTGSWFPDAGYRVPVASCRIQL